MKKITFLLCLVSFFGWAQVQTVTYSVTPASFDETQSVTLTINGNSVNEAAWGITGNALYLWSWSYDLNDTNSIDCPTNGSWENSSETNKFTYNAANDTYTKTIVPTTFYNRTGIGKIGLLVKAKNANGDKKSQDIYVEVGTFQITASNPAQGSTTIVNAGSVLPITASSSLAANWILKVNGVSVATTNGTTTFSHNYTMNTDAAFELTATEPGSGTVLSKTYAAITTPAVQSQALPVGMHQGINYNAADPTKATLVLYAPLKSYVHVLGSFNNWQLSNAYLMKKDTANPDLYWMEITGLTPGTDYTFQYRTNDGIKTADPYSTLILSPYDDPYITAATYPNMPVYPAGQSFDVSVLKTNQAAYNWQVSNFIRPSKEKLVIYELLIRDFNSQKTWTSLSAQIEYFKNLKINAIEIMPVMEFEGNNSWGYNTAFHLALDKAYGTADSMKQFIDLCHQNGIAVILDVALNHVYGRSPLVRMWMNDPDGDGFGDPTAQNPYCNVVATHSYSVGSDLNHQSAATQYYVQRTIEHWMTEFKIDGFRWDLTKGFTQNCTNNEACTNNYNADRVAILKQYADIQWAIDPNFYIIFEHLGIGGSATEETEWANYRVNEGKGIMLWGKTTDPYNQNSMGYASNSNFNSMDFENRGFTAPRLVGYAESHDEERLMFKNLQYGNATTTSPVYNVRTLTTALNRMKAIGAVLLTIPGPKMIWQFGELGYDHSINECENGTINNDCRTSPKPIPFENGYSSNPDRMAIYNSWAAINALRQNNPVFDSPTFTITSGNLLPRIEINNAALAADQLKNVIVVANFDLTAKTVNTNFPIAGTWYNLLDNTTISSTVTTVTLQPGEYKIYGNQAAVLGNEQFIAQPAISLYPNPASASFYLTKAVSQVSLYTIQGQLAKEYKGNFEARHAFSFDDVAQGLYLVKVTDADNNVATLKIVKQ